MTSPIVRKHSVNGSLKWEHQFIAIASGKVIGVSDASAYVAVVVQDDTSNVSYLYLLNRETGSELFFTELKDVSGKVLNSVKALDVLSDTSTDADTIYYSSSKVIFKAVLTRSSGFSIGTAVTEHTAYAPIAEIVRLRLEKGTSEYFMSCIAISETDTLYLGVKGTSGSAYTYYEMNLVDSAQRVSAEGTFADSVNIKELIDNYSLSRLFNGILFSMNKSTRKLYKIDLSLKGEISEGALPTDINIVAFDYKPGYGFLFAEAGEFNGAKIKNDIRIERIDPGEGPEYYMEEESTVLNIESPGDVILNQRNLFKTTPWDAHNSKITRIVVGENTKGILYSSMKNMSALKDIEFSEKIEYVSPSVGRDSDTLTDIHYNTTEAKVRQNVVVADKDNTKYKAATKHYRMIGEWPYPSGKIVASLDENFTMHVTGEGGTSSWPSPSGTYVQHPWKAKQPWTINRTDYIIKRLIIEEGVTSIGNYSFYGEPHLEEVTLPNGISAINKRSFSDCSRLEQITLPDTVTEIRGEAFRGCTSMHTVNIGDGVTYIGDTIVNAFNLASSETRAFGGCISLKNVTLGNSLEVIGPYTFEGCTSLNEIDLPESVTKLGDHAFASTCIKSITIPSKVTYLGRYLFRQDTDLESVTLKCSYTSGLFTTNTFADLNEGVRIHFDDPAFLPTLNTTWYALKNPVFYYRDSKEIQYGIGAGTDVYGIIYKDGTGEVISVSEKGTTLGSLSGTMVSSTCIKHATHIDIADRITTISQGFLYDQVDMVSVHLPDALITIGNSALNGCTSLQSVTFPSGVVSIGTSAFQNCTSLSDLELNEGLTTIGQSGFYRCSELEEIVIPSTVTSLGTSAFRYTKLLNIYFKGRAPTFGNTVFSNRNISDNMNIYIPDGDTSWNTHTSKTSFYGAYVTWHRWNPETGEVLS